MVKTNANWAWSGGVIADLRDDDTFDHWVGRSSYPIPRTRPPKPVPIDIAALEAFNLGVARARADYYVCHCPHFTVVEVDGSCKNCGKAVGR